MGFQKGVLSLNGNKLTRELKNKIRAKINSSEGLEIREGRYHRSKRKDEVIGHVVDIRYNDKKKTNTLTVNVDHDHIYYQIDYTLHVNWVTREIEYVERW